MYRTISIKIKPTLEQHELFFETMQQFTSAFRECIDYGWSHKTTNKRKIHHATYYPLRKKTSLPADVLIQARQKACETLESLCKRRKQGKKISKPKSSLYPIRYNHRSSRIDLVNGIISLSTHRGRIKIPFKFCNFYRNFINSKYCCSDLIYCKNEWFLNIVFKLPTPEIKPTIDCVGIDLGINRLAVTSQHRFYSSKHLHGLLAKYQRLRSDLQSKRSKSARKKLKRISGYWRRLQKNVNHVVSKEIANSCPEGFAIAMEDLTGIRERAKYRKKRRGAFHSWAFYQFKEFIRYKAEAKGISILLVDPQNTSKTCSHCNRVSPRNRKSQSLFTCEACGISLNADFNASQNIRQLGISLLSSLSVNQRNVGSIMLADKLTALAISS